MRAKFFSWNHNDWQRLKIMLWFHEKIETCMTLTNAKCSSFPRGARFFLCKYDDNSSISTYKIGFIEKLVLISWILHLPFIEWINCGETNFFPRSKLTIYLAASFPLCFPKKRKIGPVRFSRLKTRSPTTTTTLESPFLKKAVPQCGKNQKFPLLVKYYVKSIYGKSVR